MIGRRSTKPVALLQRLHKLDNVAVRIGQPYSDHSGSQLNRSIERSQLGDVVRPNRGVADSIDRAGHAVPLSGFDLRWCPVASRSATAVDAGPPRVSNRSSIDKTASALMRLDREKTLRR